MRIVKVIPTKRFGGSWTFDEGDGVRPAYRKREDALSQAKRRFGGIARGEIHIYDAAGRAVEVIRLNELDLGRS
jgi:hypothetical protein